MAAHFAQTCAGLFENMRHSSYNRLLRKKPDCDFAVKVGKWPRPSGWSRIMALMSAPSYRGIPLEYTAKSVR